jgi:cell division cycle 2-like protein
MTTLTKIGKLGAGTYGYVYSAKTQESEDVAVKRNFVDMSVSGIGSMRELSFLKMLREHPCTVEIMSVALCDPFDKSNPMTPAVATAREADKMREDKLHFVMKMIKHNSEEFISRPDCTPEVCRAMITQLLLGLEFMHSNAICHRDIKPENCLVSYSTEGIVQLKICDFGLSQVLSTIMPTTPKVTTSWYRAPEVCCGYQQYTNKIDMWAAGCTIFQYISKVAFLNGVTSSSNDKIDEDILNNILGRLPTPTKQSVLDHFFEKGVRVNLNAIASPIRRRTFKELLNLDSSKEHMYEEAGFSLDDFCDLLSHLLVIDPQERWSATKALEHRFFDIYRQYIKNMRESYPPNPGTLPFIVVTKCIERQWAAALIVDIYNKRQEHSWYKHRDIFHSLDLFDRYLEWAWSPDSKIKLRPSETKYQGRLHSEIEVKLRLYVCMYMIHKFFSTMYLPTSWREFIPEEFRTTQFDILAEQFEIQVAKNVVAYGLYRQTLFEMPEQYNHKVDEHTLCHLLQGYTSLESWSEGSCRALYRKLVGMSI